MRIIIDAGHGGADSGAVSVDGKKLEKNYTLMYAKALGEYLDKNNFTTFLPRTTDINTPFHNRTSVAGSDDLFISIHFDEDSSYGGGSLIYYADYYTSAADRLAASKKFADDEQSVLNTRRVVGSTTSRFNRLYIDDNNCPAILIEVAAIDEASDKQEDIDMFCEKVLEGLKKYLGLDSVFKVDVPFKRVFIVTDSGDKELDLKTVNIVGDKLYIKATNKVTVE